MQKNVPATITNVSLHLLNRNLRLDLLLYTTAAHMHTHDVTGNPLVSASLVIITNNENHIETRQNGGLEINILSGGLQVIVTAEDRVRGSQN